MTEQLTTQNATITTATIQVQALTIGRKQVTQSVFRQLREEPLLADDCSLNGAPWGVVNYHPDKCGDHAEHLHIVWQRGEQLLRTTLYTPGHSRHFTATAGALVEASIVAGLRRWSVYQGAVDELFIGRPSYPGASAHARFRYEGVRFFGEISPLAYAATGGDIAARQELPLIVGDTTVEDLLPALPVAEYHKAWQTALALPHLFIAV